MGSTTPPFGCYIPPPKTNILFFFEAEHKQDAYFLELATVNCDMAFYKLSEIAAAALLFSGGHSMETGV